MGGPVFRRTRGSTYYFGAVQGGLKGGIMRVRILIVTSGVLCTLAFLTRGAKAETIEYSLTGWCAHYSPSYSGVGRDDATQIVLYDGPPAHLVGSPAVRLVGHWGQGKVGCYEWDGSYHESWSCTYRFVNLSRLGLSGLWSAEKFEADLPPRDQNVLDTLTPVGSAFQDLAPGDTLKVELHWRSDYCEPANCGMVYSPAVDVWEAILLLEIETEVGVEQSTWGAIKNLFETQP